MCDQLYLNCMSVCLYDIIWYVIHAGVIPSIQLYVGLMCMVTDKPLAGTLGGLLQQCLCCIPWRAALLVIHRSELLY